MSDGIKAVKLVSGEELVVEVTEETKNNITFKNPVASVLQRSQQTGGAALGFMPWMHSSNGPFTIAKDKIIVVAEVADEVKNGYNQIFGTGIVVPPKQLITG
jgi:hypothetical protein